MKLSNTALESQISFQFTPLVTIQPSCIHYDHFFLHSRSNPLCYTQTPQQTWRASFSAPNYSFIVTQTYLTHSPIVPKMTTQNHILFSAATASTPLWRAKPTQFLKKKGGTVHFPFHTPTAKKKTTRLNKIFSSGHFILTSFTGHEQSNLSSTSTHIGHLLSEDWGLYIRSTFCSLCNTCLRPKKKSWE